MLLEKNKQYESVSDIDKLQLRVFVLGYTPMGESVLVIVWDEERSRALKSLFIDCFEKNNINRLENILEEHNLEEFKLDYIVWTHPDKDHSVGFHRIIKKYTSKDTLFLVPDGFTKARFLPFSSVGAIFSFIEFIWLGKRGKVERVNASNEREYPIVYGSTIYKDNVRKSLGFKIEILTPFAGQSFNKTEINKNLKANDISISLIVRFAECSFYFGGDTMDNAIKEIEPERLCNTVFIKIPHHGSNSSEYLPKLLVDVKEEGNMDEAISVCTSFKKGKCDLPNVAVLDHYKHFSSKILLTKSSEIKDGYGIWRLIYNASLRTFDKPIPIGDASVYYERTT